MNETHISCCSFDHERLINVYLGIYGQAGAALLLTTLSAVFFVCYGTLLMALAWLLPLLVQACFQCGFCGRGGLSFIFLCQLTWAPLGNFYRKKFIAIATSFVHSFYLLLFTCHQHVIISRILDGTRRQCYTRALISVNGILSYCMNGQTGC